MKKTIAFLLSAVILISFCLTSCGKTVKMKFDEDDRLVSSDKTVYSFAPVGYEPTYQGEEYGYIDDEIGYKLYRIKDIDPKEWLTCEYTGAATTIFYNEEITLPTLGEMSPTLCNLCQQDDNVYCLYTLGDEANGDYENEKELIDALVSALGDDSLENCLWPRTDASETYQLKFFSADWPAFYYNVVYCVCTSGNYIYDRVTDRCIEIGALLDRYLSNTFTDDSSAAEA